MLRRPKRRLRTHYAVHDPVERPLQMGQRRGDEEPRADASQAVSSVRHAQPGAGFFLESRENVSLCHPGTAGSNRRPCSWDVTRVIWQIQNQLVCQLRILTDFQITPVISVILKLGTKRVSPSI